MPTECKHGPEVARCGLLTTLVAAILLSACDGGIFGTGSGPDADVVIAGEDTSMSGASGTGPVDGGMTDSGTLGGETDGGVESEAGDDGSGQTDGMATQTPDTSVDVPPQTGIVEVGFTNTLAGGDTTTPRVRLVNTTTRNLRLFHDDGNAFGLLTQSAAGDTGIYTDVPDASEGLVIAVAADTGVDAATVSDRDLLYRIAPLELGVASVSSLIVSATENGIAVMPLSTMTRSDDAAQALVRIVPTTQLTNDNGPPDTAFQLTPAGDSPGGVEVSFPATSADNASSAYLAVPAGDYRLSASDARVEERALSIAAGSVYTLLVTGRSSLLVLIDGSD